MRGWLRLGLLVALPIGFALLVTHSLLTSAQISTEQVLRFGSARMHVLAFAAAALELAGRGIRTATLARAVQARVPFMRALRLQMCADGAAAITPARAGADPSKLVLLQREGIEAGRAGVILAGEAISEAFAVTLMAASFVLLLPGGRLAGVALLGYPLMLMSVVSVILFGAHNLRRMFVRALPVSLRRKRIVLRTAHAFSRHVRGLLAIRGRIALLIALGTVIHIVARASILPIVLADNLNWSNAGAVITWPLAIQYGGVIVPVPSGGGTLEAALALALRDWFDANILMPGLIWWRIYTFYLGAIAGLLTIAVLNVRKKDIT